MKLSWKRFAAIAALALMTEAAQARTVTIKLSGNVTYLFGDMASQFAIGAPVVAILRYDSASPGDAWYPGGVLDPHIRYFSDAALFGVVKLGSYSVGLPGARMFVTDNGYVSPTRSIDRFMFEDTDPIAAPVAGRAIDNLFFNWQDDPAQASRGLALANSEANVSSYGLPSMAIDWNRRGGKLQRVQVAFSAMSVSDIPEPADWMLCISGFGCAGMMMRTRRRRDQIA